MSMTKGQVWWSKLSPDKKSAFIAKKEGSRRPKRRADPTGKRELLPGGLVKIWRSRDSYAIYKPSMLDDSGNPKV